MNVLFIVLVAVVCLVFIGYPLFKGSRGEVLKPIKPAKSSLGRNKEVLMSTLGEIEFDYQMKKLSDEDYRELKSNYSAAVASILTEQQNAATIKANKKSNGKARRIVLSEIEQEIEADLRALEKSEIEKEIEADRKALDKK